MLLTDCCIEKDAAKVTQHERQLAKGVVFGIIYGIGAKNMSETMSITLQQAQVPFAVLQIRLLFY